MLGIIIIVNLLAAIAAFYRVLKGPSVFDRIAAVDSIGIMFLVILVFMSYYFERQIFMDVALVYGLLLFIDILIMAKYFGKTGSESR